MKIVVIRFSVELGISDDMYTELMKYQHADGDTKQGMILESRVSSLLGCRSKLEQVYDSWEEAGYD
jgi:hypothetical protein